jgi:hypothetical protein
MSDYRCQHCGSSYPPADFMYHKADCPHGKLSPERLSEVPAWQLEEELLRRASPRCLTEFFKAGHVAALEQAVALSDCLVVLLKLSRLTRYTTGNLRHTTLNVPTGIVCEIDRLLAERGVVPLRLDDHVD